VGATEMVRQWRHGLEEVLPGLDGHLLNSLAVFSLAMALAGHCHSGRVAAVAPIPRARALNRQRRWERLLSNRRLRPHEAMGMPARRRGARWLGPGVEVFKKAGWREANVVATWERCCREPWLLASDLPATFMRCRNYCKRAWCEQLHRDEKSHGFNWQLSRVRDPGHAERLVLVMALATLLCLSPGTRLIKRGLRKLLEPTRRRLLSVFQLGLRWLKDCLVNRGDCPCQLYLYPS